jgi:hypothetical protein
MKTIIKIIGCYTHAKDKHTGAAKALFCKIPMETCEARRHGSDTNQSNQVGDSILQAKEWMREFGRCNCVEHADTMS